MAIAGSGGWIPSNRVKLHNGEIVFTAMTQNKPKEICNGDVPDVVRRLLAGELVTVDIRHEFMSKLREALDND